MFPQQQPFKFLETNNQNQHRCTSESCTIFEFHRLDIEHGSTARNEGPFVLNNETIRRSATGLD